jgi:hypothetical protein
MSTRFRHVHVVTTVAGTAAIAMADSPRTAILASVAGGAVALTRLRFAALAATVLLVFAAAFSAAGLGPARDERHGVPSIGVGVNPTQHHHR